MQRMSLVLLVLMVTHVGWCADTIKVGALFSVTGKGSFLGEPEKNTAAMIAEEINAKGGINGKKIELLVEDTESSEATAVMAAQKLISRDQVVAIIGPSTSGETMAVLRICEEQKVPLVSCAAAAPIVQPVAERKWIFKSPQMDSDCVVRIFEHMKTKGIDKVGIITITDGFGKSGRDQLLKLATEMEITVVADETYAPTDTDMTAQLTKIKASEAKAVVNWSIGPTQSLIPKNMKQLGMTIPLYQSHGFGNLKYVEAAGDSAEGIIFPAGRLLVADELPADHPQKKVLVDYKTAYEAKFGGSVSTFGGHAYDALHLVAKAAVLGAPTREGIRDGLEKIQGFVGTAGIFNMSDTDHLGLTKDAFEMLTVKNGKFVILKD
ncbi:MAG TPA: ABC transporter substrate-binding protein [bacterium]|nr:ABC transporter substrate-binding protein [bacterium]